MDIVDARNILKNIDATADRIISEMPAGITEAVREDLLMQIRRDDNDLPEGQFWDIFYKPSENHPQHAGWTVGDMNNIKGLDWTRKFPTQSEAVSHRDECLSKMEFRFLPERGTTISITSCIPAVRYGKRAIPVINRSHWTCVARSRDLKIIYFNSQSVYRETLTGKYWHWHFADRHDKKEIFSIEDLVPSADLIKAEIRRQMRYCVWNVLFPEGIPIIPENLGTSDYAQFIRAVASAGKNPVKYYSYIDSLGELESMAE